MEQKGSLWSRIRPPVKMSPKKICGFLALPGEVRNLVYHYYFREDYRCEVAAEGWEPPKPQKAITLTTNILKIMAGALDKREANLPNAPTTIRVSRPLGKYKRIDGLKTIWLNSLYGLILVCKLVHQETIIFLYHQTTFVFEAPKRINNFLGVVRHHGHITRLQLHYQTYGHPSLAADDIWRKKHIASWNKACKAVAKSLINLQALEIFVRLHGSYIWMDLCQEWVRPLLQLQRFGLRQASQRVDNNAPAKMPEDAEKGLKLVEVHLASFWTEPSTFNPNLRRVSVELHDLFAHAIALAIMGASEKEAMAPFMKAWHGKFSHYKHHLQFNVTGW